MVTPKVRFDDSPGTYSAFSASQSRPSNRFLYRGLLGDHSSRGLLCRYTVRGNGSNIKDGMLDKRLSNVQAHGACIVGTASLPSVGNDPKSLVL